MGIPHYFLTISQTYSGVVHHSKPIDCDHYLLDYNGILHTGARMVIDAAKDTSIEESAISEEVWTYTEKCMGIANPRISTGIYIDGVAPIAKISQQRKRRYLTVKRQELEGKEIRWDTNAISPGTAFMIRIYAFLRRKIREHPKGHSISLSGSEEPGEGEHKLFAKIASLSKKETVFIHGMDADLIMLSLMSHRAHLYLMREPSWPYSAETTEDGFIYLSIDTLREALLKELRDKYQWPIPTKAIENPYDAEAIPFIETYVVMCFLLGNDFLPHGPTLKLRSRGHEQLLQAACRAYDIVPMGAVVDQQVYMPFLLQILQEIVPGEDEAFFATNKEYVHRKPRPEDIESYPLREKDPLANEIMSRNDGGLRSGASLASQPGSPPWRSRYYKGLFFSRFNDTGIVAQACKEYLTGICWTYRYYKRLSKPWDWYYPYGYAPTLQDVRNYLQGTIHTWEELQRSWKEIPSSTPAFLDATLQLLCILPRQSLHLLPIAVRSWVTDPKYGCTHLFPTEYPIQTYLHTKLWECHPVLPALDIPWLLDISKRYQGVSTR